MEEYRKINIKKTYQATMSRRGSMCCKVIECKVDKSTLSKVTRDSLFRLFLEGKWLYNAILASDDISKFDTKVKKVKVKVLDDFEMREINTISSQMKQGVQARLYSSMSSLKALREKGYKTGKLKFKREIKSIPLKQHENTFTIFPRSKTIKIQGIKKPLKVNGLNQMPKNCEIANANLVKIGNDFFVKITVYTEKEIINVPDKSIGIDFGCTTQLTLSNGEKIAYQVPINKRIKKLDQKLSKTVKGSKNRNKILVKREKSYKHITNQRNDIKNKIVHKLVSNYKTICFQDESISAWKASGHGRKIQFSAIGGIISALQRKAVTPVVIRKRYPSTQICSHCGNRQKMSQWERTYLCKSCGKDIDRDINSAINIEKEGISSLVISVPRESRDFKPVEIIASAGTRNDACDSKQLSTNQETPPSLVVS